MVAYFKKYRIMAYAIALLGPLVIIGIIFLITGTNLLADITGGVTYIACLLILMFVMSRVFGTIADRKTEEALAAYNRDCDPETFCNLAKEPARAIYEQAYRGALTELGAWLLAPYALACADRGQNEDADLMEQVLIKGIPDNALPVEKASMLINIEPLTLRVRGAEAALDVATQAQDLLASDQEMLDNGLVSYLNCEIPLLNALISGDTDTMLSYFNSVRTSASNPMRMRVLDADAAAAIYEARGEVEAQKECLTFVVENGNQLPVVSGAKAKLASL